MKEKKLLFAYGITLLAALTALLVFKLWEESPSGKYYEACEDMDSQEKHYDADGYFIMISTGDSVVGTYWCNKPLHHYKCRVCVQVTTPQVFTVDLIENIGIDLDLADLKEIYETIPEGTPLLIY